MSKTYKNINHITGDLIAETKTGKYDFIIHCANCFGVMGAGIAPKLAEAFNGVREADLEFSVPVGSSDRLGLYSFAVDKRYNAVKVINFYGQYDTGTDSRKFNYEALALFLEKFTADVEDWQKMKRKKAYIGIPKFGAGLAGGNWDVIECMIANLAPSLKFEVVSFGG